MRGLAATAAVTVTVITKCVITVQPSVLYYWSCIMQLDELFTQAVCLDVNQGGPIITTAHRG